jgi:ATP-dependent Clp protease ATP-binding subunit ClpC
MVKELRQQLEEMDITLTITDQAKELLTNKGFDPDFGARPLRRAIQRYIENPLAEEILKGTFGEGGTITVDSKEGEFVFY